MQSPPRNWAVAATATTGFSTRRPARPHPGGLILLATLLGLIAGLAGCTTGKVAPTAQEHHQPPVVAFQYTIPAPPPDPSLHDEAGELTPAEPDQFLEEELARFEALGDWDPAADSEEEINDTVYDFPVVMNKHVEFYLDYFQNDLRITFERWLARSGRYVPMIREKLREAGLPEDLAYLPMIESGYSLTAYSRARAVGPWQFMAPTARQYGLAINDYLDERRDPIRSTQAAINFLGDLYEEFGCWHLATAAYNAGGGRIRGAMRRFNSDDFWEISRNNHLALETRHYVPKLIAAIIIAKNPEEYGFDNIAYDEPLRYETLQVPRWTALEAVALAGDFELDELHDLNRQLRRLVTPPEQANYTLRLPQGSKQQVAAKLPRVRAVAEVEYRTHVVRRGDTLTGICNRYNINKTTLLKANSLRSEQLIIGQRLRIPTQKTAYVLLPEGADPQQAGLTGAGPDGLVLHKIKPGESMWVIARRYGVSIDTLAAWNDISDPRRIRAGQQLALYLKPAPGEKPVLAASGSKQPAGEQSQPEVTYYQVQGGDTLWSIARKFQTTAEMIRQWNQLNGDLIHPGKKLLIRLAELR
ncbi:LysM peptidoglycan-binding domain-containing protein [Desulfurivibrio alkaliphilus]|uniref:Lytic transglycosylase catalytic n=1 Tax=Desulfurivibrio alkaliphilus (strain DSM 19089 / UNIQEM U267 / AHT2) TaxID=589865 RepID=D6Z4A7_DESAT|nr:LysM peptidoglycan-binding domain-containing protein [Desulfurivibrio alkaliphilus]ADH86382.1 Lytic transglycosylase catalytic [Desulfurivibrio alkaliphilus AHT 2]